MHLYRRPRLLRIRLATPAAGVAILVAATALAGCGSSASPRSAGRVTVVAGEDTWGNIAAQLGGAHASVTSIITDPNADPHAYTADAADAAAIAGAQLVIENGASYDDFMGQLLSASGTSPDVLTVATLVHAQGTNPNPHFWYDLTSVVTVARSITAAYERADPSDRAYFAARLARFDSSLAPIRAVVHEIAAEFPGAPVAYTERVPGYLCEEAGLDVRTPTGFAAAIESGNDPDVADTLAMDRLLSTHAIRVLLYNTQTVSSVTTGVRAAALAAHVAVVAVTETLPSKDATYQAWQLSQDRALLAALAR